MVTGCHAEMEDVVRGIDDEIFLWRFPLGMVELSAF